jgi:hypothetical protein
MMNLRIDSKQGKVALDLEKAEETTLVRALELSDGVVDWLERIDDTIATTSSTRPVKVDPAKVENMRRLAAAMHEAITSFREAGRDLS